MQYRTFGKTGEKLSILGFGMMRLPVINNETSRIDKEKALPMVRSAIDAGINYLDTAWPYHGGVSEAFTAEVMKDGYRDKVKVATKLPPWEVESRTDMDRILNTQLERLEIDQIDFYLLHALNKSSWKKMKKLDYKSFLLEAREAGKIKYLGFSMHDDIETYKEIVDDFDWDFCQIQLNYLDEKYQAGLEGLRYAAARGMGVIIMEPLRGGMLAKTEMPDDLKAIWDAAPVRRSPASWALRYVWDMEEVGLVLSGMGTQEQSEENIATASEALPGSLSPAEAEAISKAQKFFHDRIKVDCTNCQYCMPCPQGVYIPELFWAYNHDSFFGDAEKAKYMINIAFPPEQRASACVECGQCEEHCPQNLPIISHLKDIAARYEIAE